ncbi:hypothetical protein L6452_07598 [Arctium lappa]|uniref:Uncharacterized protein n=1 Tax=Arctium lappa TaxID=4217 RepID=A0ACB9EKV3_ARCLA|nr:hypothetical protein L6452_07598 [Arctium lappa]
MNRMTVSAIVATILLQSIAGWAQTSYVFKDNTGRTRPMIATGPANITLDSASNHYHGCSLRTHRQDGQSHGPRSATVAWSSLSADGFTTPRSIPTPPISVSSSSKSSFWSILLNIILGFILSI